MPTIKCPNSTPCQDPAIPITNYSSEAPDSFLFTGRAYPIVNPNDPIDPSKLYNSEGCLSACQSSISQDDADLCAARQAFICANGGGGGGTVFFYNRAQGYSLPCPDGSLFTYVVAAGLFVNTNQALADEQAAAYARAQAGSFIICLNSIPDGAVGAAYSAVIASSTHGFPPFTFSLTGGLLPPGLNLSSSGVVSGVPTVPGSFTFSVRAVDQVGNFMQRTMTVCAVGISPASLPNATQGANYKQVLTAPICAIAPFSYQVTSGTLPPGLTLNEFTGTISGIPTTQGVFNFVVTLQTEAT